MATLLGSSQRNTDRQHVRMTDDNVSTTCPPPPLAPDALAGLRSVAEVCDVLRGWGRPDLADRLAYFVSNEDLDDGDVSLTLESALGFLAFFGAVETDGKIPMTCT